MSKEKKYFIISSIVIILISIYSIVNVDSIIKTTLNSLSNLHINLSQDFLDILSKKAIYIIPNVFSIIIALIISLISIRNKICDYKKLMIVLGFALFVCASNTIISILSVINIIVSINIKGIKKEKKGIPELERYTDGIDGVLLAVACLFVYSLYLFFITPTGYISAAVCSFIILSIIIILFWKNLWRDLVIFSKSVKEYILFILPRIGIMYIIYFIACVVCFSINKNIPVNQQQINTMPDWYILVLATFFAPIVEEVVFRGCIRRFIKNDTLFIIVSGVIFGLLHTISEGTILGALFMAIPYATLGCGFAYIYAKTNNITNNIACHAVHNFIISLLHIIFF